MSEFSVKAFFDLKLFGEGAGEGGDAGTQGEGAATPAANVRNASQNSDADGSQSQREETREEQYRRFKNEYKDEYDAEVQSIVKGRLAKAADYRTKAERVFSVLSQKYGGDPEDLDSLLKNVEQDDSYYEDEAMEKGISVDQLKQMKRLERENAEFKRAAAQRQRELGAQKVYNGWVAGADEVKENYDSDFNLQRELNENPQFLRLLKSGVDVKTAYEVIHRDELNSKVMKITAEKTEQAVVNKIKANGLRPSENGLNTNAGTSPLGVNPRNLTKEQREEIKKRVKAGEKISF